MLLTMRALTRAARAICYATGAAIDRAHRGKDDAARKAGDQRASLLTPVAKAFSTDIGTEVASLGVQVHGGMGFIEETGAAQHYRDARIAQIYEGTNGIQAIDLVTRKMPMVGGAVVRGYLDELRRTVAAVQGDERSGLRRDRRAACAMRSTASTARPHGCSASSTSRPTRRSPARRPICACSPRRRAAARWPRMRSPACRLGGADAAGRVALARFFAENIAVQAGGLETTVTEGADSVSDIALSGAAA